MCAAPLRSPAEPAPAPGRADDVDMRIGVLERGNSTIGPCLPFSSVLPGPDTLDGGYDGYAADRSIVGFSQLHVSGVGWGQYGNILVAAQIGRSIAPFAISSTKSEERAEPFAYEVLLDRHGIRVELAPTRRAALYRFTFPPSAEATLIFDLFHSIATTVVPRMGGGVLGGVLRIGPDGRSVSGHRVYRGGFSATDYPVYFHAEFDRPARQLGVWRGDTLHEGLAEISASEGERIGACLSWPTGTGGEEGATPPSVQMRIGISLQSLAQARRYLTEEIPHWDLATLRAAGRAEWDRRLGAIRLRADSPDQRAFFYTSLFRCMTTPRDRSGEFTRFDPKVPMWDDHYALWDTWRTLFPLLALIRPDVVRDTLASFVERQRVDGIVNDAFIGGANNPAEQGGNSVDCVIADAHARGVRGVDWAPLYALMKHNAERRRLGCADPARNPHQEHYRQHGWIPAGLMNVSYTLEYAYNDYLTSRLAEALGDTVHAAKYRERSTRWQALWNPALESDGFRGFIAPKDAAGQWLPCDLKAYPGSWKPYFYEANSWTYSFNPPHQLGRVVELMGGPEETARRLEHAFAHSYFGMYNEPAFLMPQMFHHAGRPDLASKWLRHTIENKFTRFGYPGDDDSGAMASFYIWATLGLFPNAGQDFYYLNRPLVPEAVIERPEDGALTIRRLGGGAYVRAVWLNGRAHSRSWLRHAEIAGETEIVFETSDEVGDWGRAEPPPSLR